MLFSFDPSFSFFIFLYLGLLISITTIERITAIEELCNNLESSNTNPEISEESNNCIDDYDDGIAPALCKQIMFSSGIIPACCASDKYELHEDQEEDIRIYWKELKLLLRAMELLLSKHWSPKTLDQIFKKYGDFMISSVVDVINQCMDNTDTLQINKCYIIPTIISGTVILKQCSRGSKSMRKRTLHLEGLLPLLIHLLNGTWLQNNSATSESKTATNTIRGNAMGTIANLPVDQPAMKYLTDFPLLLDSVTEILCEESGNLKEYAIVFMVNMTYSKYCVELMIKTKPKIILSIAKLIRNETNVKMEIFALRIIENFMKSDHAAISVEKYALENLLLLFQIRKIKYDQMKKISIDHQHMEDENLFRASKILLQLSNTASVAVMINKPDIIPKIVGATFFFNCDNDCENNSKLNSYAKNPSEKLQISLQLHVIKMLTNFTFAIKSPLSPGYKDLIQSLTKLLSRKKYQEKICWLLLHQIGLDDDYDHNDDNDSSRQLSIISTHGLLENLSSIILDNDSTMLSSLRASAILLNLSSSNLCHPTMINNKTCMSAIINRSKETKQTSESDTPFEKEESKMLLTRTAINLVLNKNNQKKLEKYHEKIMQVLVVAASPRKMAFEGAKEAIWTLLQD